MWKARQKSLVMFHMLRFRRRFAQPQLEKAVKNSHFIVLKPSVKLAATQVYPSPSCWVSFVVLLLFILFQNCIHYFIKLLLRTVTIFCSPQIFLFPFCFFLYNPSLNVSKPRSARLTYLLVWRYTSVMLFRIFVNQGCSQNTLCLMPSCTTLSMMKPVLAL